MLASQTLSQPMRPPPFRDRRVLTGSYGSPGSFSLSALLFCSFSPSLLLPFHEHTWWTEANVINDLNDLSRDLASFSGDRTKIDLLCRLFFRLSSPPSPLPSSRRPIRLHTEPLVFTSFYHLRPILLPIHNGTRFFYHFSFIFYVFENRSFSRSSNLYYIERHVYSENIGQPQLNTFRIKFESVDKRPYSIFIIFFLSKNRIC